MIQAQNLPPGKSVYDYPAVFPGQEMTQEQSTQAQLAILAGTVMSVATAKQLLVTNTVAQVVALLRVADLTTQASIDAFAKSAAKLVEAAIAHSRTIVWSGVSLRAKEMGVSFPATPPPARQIPKKFRFSRKSSLVDAYRRIALDYQENLLRRPDDPIIEQLVEEVEGQMMTPIQRPEMISSDVEEREIVGEEEWWQEFREEDQVEEEGQAKARTQAKSRVAERRARAKEALAEHQDNLSRERNQRDRLRDQRIREYAESSEGFAESARSRRREIEAKLEQRERDAQAEIEAMEAEGLSLENEFQLTDSEVEELIERYAQQKAEEAAERAVNHDIQATARNTHALAMDKLPKNKVVGYRRVIHPELSQSGQSCGLCIVASTMRYTRGDLLPIHSMCNCETIEIYQDGSKEFDPGDQINKEDLRVFYEEASKVSGSYTTHGWDLKRSRYSVVDHPEYGPILVNVKRANKDKKAEAVPYTKNGENNA